MALPSLCWAPQQLLHLLKGGVEDGNLGWATTGAILLCQVGHVVGVQVEASVDDKGMACLLSHPFPTFPTHSIIPPPFLASFRWQQSCTRAGIQFCKVYSKNQICKGSKYGLKRALMCLLFTTLGVAIAWIWEGVCYCLFLQAQHIFVVKCISGTSILYGEMFVFRLFSEKRLRSTTPRLKISRLALISADVLTDTALVLWCIFHYRICKYKTQL